MTLKKRLNKIERTSIPPEGDQPNCIYLCALTANDDEPSDPRVALSIGGEFGASISRLPDEGAAAFVKRVEKLFDPSQNKGNRPN